MNGSAARRPPTRGAPGRTGSGSPGAEAVGRQRPLARQDCLAGGQACQAWLLGWTCRNRLPWPLIVDAPAADGGQMPGTGQPVVSTKPQGAPGASAELQPRAAGPPGGTDAQGPFASRRGRICIWEGRLAPSVKKGAVTAPWTAGRLPRDKCPRRRLAQSAWQGAGPW